MRIISAINAKINDLQINFGGKNKQKVSDRTIQEYRLSEKGVQTLVWQNQAKAIRGFCFSSINRNLATK
jgi:hypothetical protein